MSSELEKDKKWQDFLSLIKKRIELEKANKNPETGKTFNVKYKSLCAIFEDGDELKEYLKYAERVKKIIVLESISKQKIRDAKISDDVYLVKKKPSNSLLTGKDFFQVERHQKINYYPEDIFIFGYEEETINELLFKKEKYSQYSAESIKKTLYILERLKEEWDLVPKADSQDNGGIYTYIKKANEAQIPERRYLQWVHGAGLGDFWQLQNILTTLQQEGLLLNADFFNEAM